MPKHIKIMKNPQTDRIYVSDACDFGSMHELVEYYQKNSLGISFPGVDTTLKHSYLDVIEGRVTFDRRHHSLSAAGIPPPSFPAPVLHGQTPPIMSPPWSEGVWGEALCDFNGDGPGQLSFLVSTFVKNQSPGTFIKHLSLNTHCSAILYKKLTEYDIQEEQLLLHVHVHTKGLIRSI